MVIFVMGLLVLLFFLKMQQTMKYVIIILLTLVLAMWYITVFLVLEPEIKN